MGARPALAAVAFASALAVALPLPASHTEPAVAFVSLSLDPDPGADPPQALLPNLRRTGDSDRGTLIARGVVRPPGAAVDLTVTDDAGSPPASFRIATETRDDPAGGLVPGSFRAALNLTGLGRHSAREGAPAPDDLGRSLLSLRFEVHHAGGSDRRDLRIEKRAATPGDRFAPVITQGRRPPGDWCSVTADHGGTCGPMVPLPQFQPTGEAAIQGSVEDMVPEALGAASEIADVVVRIWNPDGSLRSEHRSFMRQGTRAYYAVSLRHRDFEPVAPAVGPTYSWSVHATDAWGNQAQPVTGTFRVWPT